MPAIRLHNVSVNFPIYNGASRSFRTEILRAVGGKINEHHKTIVVEALRDITFDLKDGDRLALIGHNGAGKTTLLRVLSGIYPPSHGSIAIDGSVSTLTNISMGMDMELNGYDNILIRLIFMGLTFKQAKALVPEVAEFSELGEYLELPVRTYSTGMFLRLAFAAATSVIPEILVLDEMISAGDARFIQKAKQRTMDMVERTKIMVLASHDMTLLNQYCNKALWLDHGLAKAIGPVKDVYEQYRASNPVTS